MLKRILQSRQCPKLHSIATRNICGLMRYSNLNNNHISNPYINNAESNIIVNKCKPSHLSTPSPFQYVHIRQFGKKIKVYNQPDVGEGTVEVDILEWLVKPGDTVRSLQTIGRGKYEKADVDILAPTYDGVVHRLIVPSGEIAIVGKPLIEFEVDDDGTISPDDRKAANNDDITETISSSTVAKQVSVKNTNILALPSTKRFAKEHNIDLSLVTGSGKDGRILKEDVMAYMARRGKQGATTTTIQPPTTPPPKPMKKLLSTGAHGTTRGDHVEKIFGVKKAMVKKMSEANHVPQFGYGDEIILNELVSLRTSLKSLGQEYGIKITYLPFILKATSLALLNPASTCLNAHVNEGCTELTHRGSHNIGVAIDSAEGLIVPNIKHIEQKSVLEIAHDLDDLVERAKNNQITNDDITGGTFTLSNIGAIGGTYCRPICFVPEVCIGALGTIKQKPRYTKNGEIYQASVMAVSFSADHRVIDGATVARFANEFKQYLENPQSMLLHLK